MAARISAPALVPLMPQNCLAPKAYVSSFYLIEPTNEFGQMGCPIALQYYGCAVQWRGAIRIGGASGWQQRQKPDQTILLLPRY